MDDDIKDAVISFENEHEAFAARLIYFEYIRIK
jgi:hypothetical protein